MTATQTNGGWALNKMKTSLLVVTQKPRLGLLIDSTPAMEIEKVAVLLLMLTARAKAKYDWVGSASTKSPPEVRSPSSRSWKRAASALKGVRTASSPSNRMY